MIYLPQKYNHDSFRISGRTFRAISLHTYAFSARLFGENGNFFDIF